MEINYLQTLIKHSPLNERNTRGKWNEMVSQLLEEQKKFLINKKYHFYGQFLVPNLTIQNSPIQEFITFSFNTLIDIENNIVSHKTEELLKNMKKLFMNSINLISANFSNTLEEFKKMSLGLFYSLPTNMKGVYEYLYSVIDIPTEKAAIKTLFNNLLVKLKTFLKESHGHIISSMGMRNPNYINALEIQIHYSLFVMKITDISNDMRM